VGENGELKAGLPGLPAPPAGPPTLPDADAVAGAEPASAAPDPTQ
jgi:hypothetical protein